MATLGSFLCENSDAKRTMPTIIEFWPVSSNQSPPNREIRSERAHFQTIREFSHRQGRLRPCLRRLRSGSLSVNSGNWARIPRLTQSAISRSTAAWIFGSVFSCVKFLDHGNLGLYYAGGNDEVPFRLRPALFASSV